MKCSPDHGDLDYSFGRIEIPKVAEAPVSKHPHTYALQKKSLDVEVSATQQSLLR